MQKVLVIRFSSIGDIVLTTPIIRVLKEKSQEAVELHFLLKEAFAPLLRADPRIDRVHTWTEERNKKLIASLREENFDHIVDLQGSLRSRRVRNSLRAPYSTFPKLNKEKWMLVNLGIDRLPSKHVVDRYFEALTPLGLENDGIGLEYFIPSAEGKAPAEEGLPEDGAYVAFAIGGAHATKKLPPERIEEICRRIQVPVVLLGGKEDAGVGERIARELEGKVIDRCGKLSLHGSASLIEKCQVVLTHDTGMMHIAAAFRKPILSFWGNTVPAFGMYPYMPGYEERSHIFGVEGLSCRPCSKLGHNRCPKGHFRCMKDIDLDEVLETLDRELTRTSP